MTYQIQVICKHCNNVIKNVKIQKELIVDTVCHIFEINKDQLRSKTRKRIYVDARFVVVWFIHKYYGKHLTYNQISQTIGKNDHTYVCHAINRINDWIIVDNELKNKIEKIESILETFDS